MMMVQSVALETVGNNMQKVAILFEQELDLLGLVIFKMEKATNKWHNISYKV
jgi:hypothetical protein